MMPRCALSFYLCLILQLFTLTKLSEGVCKNMYSLPEFGGEGPGDYCEKTLHHFNCSVGPRRNVERDTTLECKIKRKKGWEEYMKTMLNPTHCSTCEPSQLTSLRVVQISKRDYLDEKYSYPTIQLSFTVPKPSPGRSYYPGGISLTFSSNNQSMTDDNEFDTLYRLLDFSMYSYSSPDSDEINQRTLSFPCFTGFRHEPCQSEEYKVYSVSIKSFSKIKTNLQETAFSEITYNITVYNFYVYHPNLWKSTIAVAFFPREKDVSFVFDPVPDSVTFQMYNITLIDAHSTKSYRNQRIYKEQPTQNVFLGVENGVYYILIEVIITDNNCQYTRSHSFSVGNFQPIQIKVRRDSKYPTEEIKIAVILICTGIVLIVLLIGIFRYHRRKKSFDLPPLELLNGHLIYSNDRSETSTLAREFAKFCMKNMQIHISSLNPQNNIVQKDFTTCLKRELEKSKLIIIFWTPESISGQQECRNTFSHFEASVNLALNLEHQDNMKLACVYFIKSHKTSIPNDLLMAAHVFLFPEEIPKFCSYTQGHKSRRNHELTKALKHAISDLTRNSRVEYQHNQTVPGRHIYNDKMGDEDDDVIISDEHRVSWHSKSLLPENQPLIGIDDTTTICSISSHVERKTTQIVKEECKSVISDEVPAMVHISSCASVLTCQIFGSGSINEHGEHSLGSNTSESSNSSLKSISRLPLKTIPSTLKDSILPSQSSRYEHCEPITTLPSSSTNKYESLNSSSTSTPHPYQQLLPNSETGRINVQDLDSEEASPNASVENGRIIQEIDVLSHCMKCQKVRFMEDKPSEGFCDNSDSYSVRSESITSLDIDTCEFT